MATFILLLFTINLDALSFGIAYGINNQKLKPTTILYICLFSTLLFSVPLALSKYISQFFNEIVLRIINSIVLFLLGLFYIFKKETQKKDPVVKFGFKQGFFESIAISVDAMFTSLLSGFNSNYFIFAVFLYAFINYFAIFFGNYFLLKFKFSSKINLQFISGFIFIFLGFFKLIGF